MAEQLALAEEVEHVPAVDDLDGAPAHDPQVLDRLRALEKIEVPARWNSTSTLAATRSTSLLFEPVERRMLPQEAGDLRRCDWSRPSNGRRRG